MLSKCLQCKNQKEIIVTKNIESHSSISKFCETLARILISDLNRSAPELIGTGNVRTNQNTVKFETANEKTIGVSELVYSELGFGSKFWL